ncbi:RDD family protein [Shewanella gelidimarina]|uniref:RDD family protein n=1 Tax=Shewanella gelidimarina TaxID=56813 RepID=UPI00200F436A|nr:RDD family protein [Shewanella gelidimarina]MCL1059861.1 RDD family protein [Shewanella gelidimarina]
MNKSNTDEAIDPKSLVTPYAFKIAPDVLYKPLASPLKRVLAITVDGLLVAALAENAGWIFVCIVVLTVVIHKRSRTMGRAVKWALYALMLVGMVLALLNDEEESRNHLPLSSQIEVTALRSEGSSETLQTVSELANYLPEIIFASNCQDYECAQQRLVAVKDALAHSKLTAIEQTRILQELINDLPLSEQENDALNAQLIKTGIKELPIKSNNVSSTAETFAGDSVTDAPAKVDEDDWLAEADVSDSDSAEDPQSSPLAWLIGSLNDLGLGFGWAAFYFTVFTAWFDGQTLGKKLLGISVIQLDGSKITLWAAFGRYGGYAAGFTTGLLGFIQIFWDANRQAIQDKISATVVIDLRKIPLEHPQDKITVNPLNAPTHAKVVDK